MPYSYVDNYLDCVFNAVKHHCNIEAARWQASLNARSLKPRLEEIGCLHIIEEQDLRGLGCVSYRKKMIISTILLKVLRKYLLQAKP